MIFYLPPTTYIAQVYNCDTYGAAAYNECPVASDDTSDSSSTPSTTRKNQTTTGDDSAITDEPEVTDNTHQPAPQAAKPAPSKEKEITLVTPANVIATMDWTIIVPMALVLAVLIALIILLFKRRRSKQDQQT